DADAAEGASDSVTRSAGQAEQTARAMGTRSQAAFATGRQVMERLAMTRNGSIWMLTAALAFSGLAAPARAQQVSEARIRELIKQAQDPASRLQGPAMPSQGGPADNRPVVALSLDDAVKFALDRNLDIAVQRLNPEINDIAYAS